MYELFRDSDYNNNNKQKQERANSDGYLGLLSAGSIDDAMRDFQMNGLDSPYNPDDDVWTSQKDAHVPGGSGRYLRQWSWPVARSPRAPRPRSMHEPWETLRSSTPIEHEPKPASFGRSEWRQELTAEQERVINSLPDKVLWSLLKDMEDRRKDGKKNNKICRFCKNNGERESFYRSHELKEASGRVLCPVLRVLECALCGARGDNAHTRNYCPLTTAEQRMKSTAMMRSIRMASGKKRHSYTPPSSAEFVRFGQPPASSGFGANHFTPALATSFAQQPLDPLWAALEQKLLM